MQVFSIALLCALISSITAAPPTSPNTNSISIRDDINPESQYHDLEKRRGGGGGRGSGRGGSSGSSSGRAISSYSFSSASNTGGRTRDGSGTRPAYSGRYMGGAAVPYTSGGRSPTRGVTPFLLPIGAVAFFPGIWLYAAYAYPYGGYGYYRWYEDGRNRTSNVTCLCQEYSVCGCDPTDNSTLLAQMVTNGSTDGSPPVNTTTVRTVDFDNGTVTTFINGTLENGTTAPGGDEPSSEDQISAAVRLAANFAGYWIMVATVISGVMFM